jgi:hypothetical protein
VLLACVAVAAVTSNLCNNIVCKLRLLGDAIISSVAAVGMECYKERELSSMFDIVSAGPALTIILTL